MNPPIKIKWSKCGKIAVCEGGWGSATTATFIREEGRRLGSEIQQARAVYLRTREVNGIGPLMVGLDGTLSPKERRKEPRFEIIPSLDLIGEEFPQIWTLCTPDDVLRYVVPGGAGDYRRRTVLQATNEILQHLLPTASPDYIQRTGRKPKK